MEAIREQIRQADMVLVGLGEEFDDIWRPGDDTVYPKSRELLLRTGYGWLVPAWNEYFFQRVNEEAVSQALGKLAEALSGKNYFVVSAAMNSAIDKIFAGGERLVKPCGGAEKKQCSKGCGEMSLLTDADSAVLKSVFDELLHSGDFKGENVELGSCSQCGAPMVLNNIYAENYDENGYLEKWKRYTRWLQGTLNHRLFLLELGVGMRFPSVIRWPFEKIVTYNEKAFLCRIHEKLYQLPEEIAAKGCGISKNAIDWLGQLC